MRRRADITGAILAGGKSSRMQCNKALLQIDGVPLIQMVARTLQEVFSPLILIANHDNEYTFLALQTYHDIFSRCGPLAGIHAALTHAKTDSVFVAPCDVPFLSASLVHCVVRQKVHNQVTVLVGGNSLQPLCGLYHRSCLPVIERHLRRGQHSVHACLRDLTTTLISPGTEELSRALTNVNTPADYQQVLRDARPII